MIPLFYVGSAQEVLTSYFLSRTACLMEVVETQGPPAYFLGQSVQQEGLGCSQALRLDQGLHHHLTSAPTEPTGPFCQDLFLSSWTPPHLLSHKLWYQRPLSVISVTLRLSLASSAVSEPVFFPPISFCWSMKVEASLVMGLSVSRKELV